MQYIVNDTGLTEQFNLFGFQLLQLVGVWLNIKPMKDSQPADFIDYAAMISADLFQLLKEPQQQPGNNNLPPHPSLILVTKWK